jgi:hypothetical protein
MGYIESTIKRVRTKPKSEVCGPVVVKIEREPRTTRANSIAKRAVGWGVNDASAGRTR